MGVAALFPSSRDLPDEVLTFIKAHPLLDPAVPPATHQPLLTLTSRYAARQVTPRPDPRAPATLLLWPPQVNHMGGKQQSRKRKGEQ